MMMTFDLFLRRFYELLDWDSARLTAAFPKFAAATLQAGSPLANVVGFLDGTRRQICCPGESPKAYFNGHKWIYCDGFQGKRIILFRSFNPQ